MSDFKPGLEGVVAFETEIAEPDKEGGSLRYRGVDIEELVGHVSFGHVWGLLVDNAFDPGLPPAEPRSCRCAPVTCGSTCRAASPRSPRAGGCARCSTSPRSRRVQDVGRVCAQMLSFIAQSARGADLPPCRSAWSTTRRPRPRPSSSAGAASPTRCT